MASIKKRLVADGSRRYDVIYRDPNGRQRKKTYRLKSDADAFSATVEADKLRGAFIDPKAGRVTVEDYAASWLAAQTFDPSTHEAVAQRFGKHVYPVLGHHQLRNVKPSTIQAWLRGLDLAESTKKVIFGYLSTTFQAAVNDDMIGKNPCRSESVRKPRRESNKVIPWTVERVQAVHDALPERCRIMAVLGAGLGLRQGEIFGLAVDDIDFLGKEVRVVRQVKLVHDRPVFAPPKGGKTRTVPLPDTVALEIAAHLQQRPATDVMLPWRVPGGEEVTARLVVSTTHGRSYNRNDFNKRYWKRALVAAGVISEPEPGMPFDPSREHGMHALRHFYASVLLDAGESIKAVSEYLGHADAGFTLRTYTHLMPSSHERSRKAIDAAFLGTSQTASGKSVTSVGPR